MSGFLGDGGSTLAASRGSNQEKSDHPYSNATANDSIHLFDPDHIVQSNPAPAERETMNQPRRSRNWKIHSSLITTQDFGTTITNFTGVPIGGSRRVSLSSFKYFSSFIVKLVWKTVSSVTGKMEMSVPVISAP